MATELKFDEALRILTRHQVEFIVVGGAAAILQGSPLTTEDLDVVYRASEENIQRLATALAELQAHYFGPPRPVTEVGGTCPVPLAPYRRESYPPPRLPLASHASFIWFASFQAELN